MADHLTIAFQEKVFTLPLTSIVPQRSITPQIRRSQVYAQIRSSIKEIGLIEPLVVFPQNGKGFLLLDGHLRLAILQELGITEAACLLATDDESYTYNKRVNHIPPVAQHLMLLQALNSGVPEQRIAAALNVDIAAVRQKARMLDGVCPEVIELLRDRTVSPALFPILKKMKPAIQIATVELMVLRNDCSISFAKTRLALTPPDLLNATPAGKRKLKADTAAAQAILEEDTELLVRNLKSAEESYGADILTLTVACTYLEHLLENQKVARYLDRNHDGVFATLQSIVSDVRSKRRDKSPD